MALKPPFFSSVSLKSPLLRPANSSFHTLCTYLSSSYQMFLQMTILYCLKLSPLSTSGIINSLGSPPISQFTLLNLHYRSLRLAYSLNVEDPWNTILNSLNEPINHMAPEMTGVMKISKSVPRYSSSLELCAACPLASSIPMYLTPVQRLRV